MTVLIHIPKSKKWVKAVPTNYENEQHLQNMIYRDTSIIPFEDIDPDSEKRKRIAVKELGLPSSGSTDVVVIDESGEIYIIETKLAKSSEIRRKVIGQIIEYAAYLSKQNFDWLDEQVKKNLGSNLSQQFQEIEGWKKEDFEEKVSSNLQQGSFKLLIVVDKVIDHLKDVTEFMTNKGFAIYPIELRYFKDDSEIEILVPKVFNTSLLSRPESRTRRFWDEESFFLDAASKVNETTLSTLRKIYDFSKDLGEISWGHGIANGTFKVSLLFGNERIPLYIIQSSGARNWLNKTLLMKLNIDQTGIVEYIDFLKSLGLDEKKNWDSLTYPEFNITILNDVEKLESFKKATVKLKALLSNS